MLDIDSRRPDLFLINSAAMPLPSLNPSYTPDVPVSEPVETESELLPVPKASLIRITRSYNKKDAATAVEKVKMINKSVPVPVLDIPGLSKKRKPGRPRK